MSLDDKLDNEPEQIEGNDELFQRFQFTADKGQEPFRIDKFLMNRIEGATDYDTDQFRKMLQ